MSSLPIAASLGWLPAEVAPRRGGSPSMTRAAGRSARSDEAGDAEREKANAAMERYARGDDRAFSELYDSLAPRLHRYLVRASRDAGWADDLLQQTMLQIHRGRGRFIAGAEVLPWAFAIARRLLIDGLRRRRNERGTLSLETGGPEAGPVDAEAANQYGADELVDSARLARALEAELARLPASHRAAFELIKNEGLSIREAAEVLGVSPTAVKLRAHRAYAALRSALGHLIDRS